MPTYGQMWPRYAKLWDEAKIHPSRQHIFIETAKRLMSAKHRYQAIEAKTGAPWYLVAMIHEREASQAWWANISQGDRWDRRSTHVPKGRGPFKSWDEAAIDALRYMKLDKVKDWRLEKILYHLESYNGWGYHNHGVPSAYLWAGTNVYTHGKYIADGVWSNTAVDIQLGCVGLLKTMMEMDGSIKPIRETKETSPKPIVQPEHTAAGGIIVAGGAVASQVPHNYLPVIIGGAIIAAIAAFIIIKLIRRKQ